MALLFFIANAAFHSENGFFSDRFRQIKTVRIPFFSRDQVS